MFELEGRDDDVKAWHRLIRKYINEKVKMIVFILPGQKGKGKCYTDIKKLVYTSIPVTSQVVLSIVIHQGKNLRSIINKVLIQMNAKMGGVPWSLENLSLV